MLVIILIWIFFGSLNSFVLFGVGLEAVERPRVSLSNVLQNTPNSTDEEDLVKFLLRSGSPAAMPTQDLTEVRYHCKFIDKDAENFAVSYHRWLIAAFYLAGPFGVVVIGNIIIVKKLFERKSFLDKMRRGVARIRRGSGFENAATLRTTTTMLFISSAAFLIFGTPTFILLVCGPYFEPQLNRSNSGKAYLFFIRSIESFMTYLNQATHFFFYALLGKIFRKSFIEVFQTIARAFCRCVPKRYWPNWLKKDDTIPDPIISIIKDRSSSHSKWKQSTDDFRPYLAAPAVDDNNDNVNDNDSDEDGDNDDFANVNRDRTYDSGLGGISASHSAEIDDERLVALSSILKHTDRLRRMNSVDFTGKVASLLIPTTRRVSIVAPPDVGSINEEEDSDGSGWEEESPRRMLEKRRRISILNNTLREISE